MKQISPYSDRSALKLLSLITGLGASLVVPVLNAGTFIPTTGNSDWNDPNNWTPNEVPNGQGAVATLQSVTSGSGGARLSQLTDLGRLEVNLTGGGWRVEQGTGSGLLRWNSAEGLLPTVVATNNHTAVRSLTFQTPFVDPASGPAQVIEFDTNGTAESVFAFTGNNTGFTGGFHLKSSSISTLSFLTTNTMAQNAVSVSQANHRLRFGSGATWNRFAGNISAGPNVTTLTLYSNASANGGAILDGVISGSAAVDFRTYGGGDLELTGNNTYTGKTVIASGMKVTFHGVENFGVGDTIELAFSNGSPTFIYAEGNTDDLTTRGDGSQRTLNFRNTKATIDTNGNDVTFANRVTAFAQAGTGLIKKGDGVLRLLAGDNSYGLETDVEGGTLLVSNTSGSGTGASAVRVATTLGGTGRIAPGVAAGIRVETGATISPGDAFAGEALGELTIDLSATTGVLHFEDESRLQFDLGDGLTSDRITLTSGRADSIVFAGTTLLDLFDRSSSSLDEGDYTLFSGASSDIFSGLSLLGDEIVGGLALGGPLEGFESRLRLSGGDIVLELQAIPEPGSLSLLLLAGGGMLLRRRA